MHGDPAGLIYPSTHSIGFDPNAYGEPRQVRHLPSGVEYAKSASYNHYGGIASFTYGSTATRTITPNLRGMPAQILDMKSGTRRLDHQLGYDANGNLAGLIDGLDGMPRTLAYDERNRLTAITGTPGSIGNESFTYDPLDNVRRAVADGMDRRIHHDAATLRLTQATTINGSESAHAKNHKMSGASLFAGWSVRHAARTHHHIRPVGTRLIARAAWSRMLATRTARSRAARALPHSPDPSRSAPLHAVHCRTHRRRNFRPANPGGRRHRSAR